MNHHTKFHRHPVRPEHFKDATGALDANAFRIAQEWERQEMRQPAEVIARDLVASGQFPTMDEALTAVHEKRGRTPGRIARAMSRFLRREQTLAEKAAKTEESAKEARSLLAKERNAAVVLFSTHESLRSAARESKANVDRLEKYIDALAKRRADLFGNVVVRFRRELPFAHHSEMDAYAVPVTVCDVAISAGNQVLAEAKRDLAAKQASLADFETKHADDLAEVETA